VKGLGAAAPEDVSSPTFTLIHEYGPNVYHVDLYRLDEEREVATLGLEEIFEKEAVVLIEWGERFPGLIPPRHMEIRLEGEIRQRAPNHGCLVKATGRWSDARSNNESLGGAARRRALRR